MLSCDVSIDDKFIVTGSGDKKATVYEIQYEGMYTCFTNTLSYLYLFIITFRIYNYILYL